MWEALAPNTMLVVATGVGDSAQLRHRQEQKWKRLQNIGPWGKWTDEAEEELRALAERVKCGVTFAAIKQ